MRMIWSKKSMQWAGVKTIKKDDSPNVKSSLFIIFKYFQQKNYC